MNELVDFCKKNNVTTMVLKQILVQNGITYKDLFLPDFSGVFKAENALKFRDALREVNRQFKSNSDMYLEKYMLLFHGTGLTCVKNIEEKGLLATNRTRRRSYQVQGGYVYLATSVDVAETFGSLGNGNRTAVFLVLVKVRDLCPDLDQLRNLESVMPDVDIKHTLADSVYYSECLRVKGNIPNYRMVRLS